MITVSDLIPSLERVIHSGGNIRANCPICRKNRRDLAAGTRKDGTIAIKCFSCNSDRKELIEALGLSLNDILPDRNAIQQKRHLLKKRTLAREKELEHARLIMQMYLHDRKAGTYPECAEDVLTVKRAVNVICGVER